MMFRKIDRWVAITLIAAVFAGGYLVWQVIAG